MNSCVQYWVYQIKLLQIVPARKQYTHLEFLKSINVVFKQTDQSYLLQCYCVLKICFGILSGRRYKTSGIPDQTSDHVIWTLRHLRSFRNTLAIIHGCHHEYFVTEICPSHCCGQ